MRILLDDSIKSYRLNANEACIYACIAKCTRAGKGWYGNYAALADAMPFKISLTTTYRAMQKLLTLGLIEMREKETYFAIQNEKESFQNEKNSFQNEKESFQNEKEIFQNETNPFQNEIPPTTPLNNNNMNEIKKEEKQQPRALCTHDGARQQAAYEDFKRLFISASDITPEGGENWFKYRGVVCEQKWAAISETKRQAIIRDLQKCQCTSEKPFKENPYYYLCDFPDPEPQFLSGIEQDNARAAGNVLVQVKHNDLFKICTQSEAERFGLQITRIW